MLDRNISTAEVPYSTCDEAGTLVVHVIVAPERVTLLVAIVVIWGGTEVGVLVGVRVEVAMTDAVVVGVRVAVGVMVSVGTAVRVGVAVIDGVKFGPRVAVLDAVTVTVSVPVTEVVGAVGIVEAVWMVEAVCVSLSASSSPAGLR